MQELLSKEKQPMSTKTLIRAFSEAFGVMVKAQWMHFAGLILELYNGDATGAAAGARMDNTTLEKKSYGVFTDAKVLDAFVGLRVKFALRILRDLATGVELGTAPKPI